MGMLAPSMMCAQIDKLDETLCAFEKAGIEYLHIDVMDGCFVPNLMLGTDYVKQLRKLTSIPLDIHLMITEPEKKISWFDFQPGEFVSVHHESTKNWRQALQMVRDAGAKPLAAINPPTPVSVLEDVIDLIDGVLVMTVNPGLARRPCPRRLPRFTKPANCWPSMALRTCPSRWTAIAALKWPPRCAHRAPISLYAAPPACSPSPCPWTKPLPSSGSALNNASRLSSH